MHSPASHLHHWWRIGVVLTVVFNGYATDEIGNKIGKIASARLFCEDNMRASYFTYFVTDLRCCATVEHRCNLSHETYWFLRTISTSFWRDDTDLVREDSQLFSPLASAIAATEAASWCVHSDLGSEQHRCQGVRASHHTKYRLPSALERATTFSSAP